MEGTRWAFANVIVILCMVVPFTSGNHAVISTTSLYNTTTTATSGNKDRMNIVVGFNMTLDRNFTEDLNNSSSREYKNLEEEMGKTLSDIFSEMQGFHGAVVNYFLKGSVVGDFDLLFDGESNLTMLQDDFYDKLERLEQSTIDGSNVTINALEMKANFKKAVYYQQTGYICETAYCSKGYVCENGISSCVHVCTYIDDICRGQGGCLYDPIREKPTCRCTDGAIFLENKCQYEQSDDLSAILGGSIGGPLGLIALIVSVCFKFVCKSKSKSEVTKGTNVENNTFQEQNSTQVVQNNIHVNCSQGNQADARNPPPYAKVDPNKKRKDGMDEKGIKNDGQNSKRDNGVCRDDTVKDKSEAGVKLKTNKNEKCEDKQVNKSHAGENTVVWSTPVVFSLYPKDSDF